MEDYIKNIIKNGEKIDTEFKLATNKLPSSTFESVCSFLNRFGGTIILGVDDKTREPIGVNETAVEQMKKDFSNLCNNPQKINPTVYLQLKDYKINGRTILYVNIEDSSEVHRCNGRIFDRNYEGDYDITDNTYLVGNMYNRKRNVHTEDRIFNGKGLNNLRADLIERIRKMAVLQNKAHPWKDMTDMELLKSTSLYRVDENNHEEGITLAAILLFGTDEEISFAAPNYRTDALLRKINVDRYDDRDDIRTNLIDSYDRLMNFIKKHTNDPFYIEGVQRISIRDTIARELSSNILMHRNFADGIPARLIITKDSFYTENASVPRTKGFLDIRNYVPYSKNPHIAKVFKEIGYADELGSGVRNITNYTKVYSDKEPIFEEGDIFKVTVPLIEYIDSNKNAQDNVQENQKNAQDNVQENQKNVIKVNETAILDFCREAKSLKEIIEYFGYKSVRGFRENYINPLLKENKLKQTIPDKPKSKNQKYIIN